jgi:hypothetical protein
MMWNYLPHFMLHLNPSNQPKVHDIQKCSNHFDLRFFLFYILCSSTINKKNHPAGAIDENDK